MKKIIVSVESTNLIDLVIGLVLIIINSLIYIFIRKSILNIIKTINELLTGNVKENYME